MIIVTGKENYLPAGAAGVAGVCSGAAGVCSGAAGAGAGASSFFWHPTAKAKERAIINESIITKNFFILKTPPFIFKNWI